MLQGVALGGVAVGIAHGIGQHFGHNPSVFDFGNEFGRALAHGLSQGGLHDVAGGSFGDGFLGGFFGSVGSSLMSSPGFGNTFDTRLSRLFAAVVIGGTASELGGGKFGNGALSAAFVEMFGSASLQYPEHHYGELGSGNVRLSYGGAGSGVYAEGTRAQMESLAVSLDKLYRAPSTRREIDALIATPRNTPLIVLNTSGVTGDVGNNTEVATGQIQWHPMRAGRYNAPAFVSLGHEIHHAYEYITGTIQGFSIYEGMNPPWEMGAMRAENRIRSFYGIQRKQNYTPIPYYYEPSVSPMMVLPTFEVTD